MAKKELPKHLTKGGPGDQYIGDGKVDSSSWFTMHEFDKQVKDQDIWFCSAPFQMLYTNTNGDYYPCSWAYSHNNAPNINDITPFEYFVYDEELNQMRKEMVTPGSNLETCKKVCASCLRQEYLYGRSRRQASLKIQSNDHDLWPRIRKAVRDFKENGHGIMVENMFEVQIKAFGNKCNLDCYMCNPIDSSIRTKTMLKEEHKDQKIFKKYIVDQAIAIKDLNFDDDYLIQEIASLSKYIYNLKLIGGEPLVMKNYYKLLDAISRTKYSNKIMVKYQTNLSTLIDGKYDITDYVNKFDKFEITVSLDSIGKANDYIRRRSNWDEIVKNIKKMASYDNVKINVNGAVSFLSVLRFYELIEWFDKNNEYFDQINWSNIRYPETLCANNLPEEIKADLIPKYEGFPDIQNVLKEESKYDYQQVFDYLLTNDKLYEGTRWEMNLFEVFPELEEFYIPKATIPVKNID